MLIHHGAGLLDKAINSLPVELHLPSYQFCGPGTKLQQRLARGDTGINPLDAACKEHDIAYSNTKNLHQRHEADKILQTEAWKRVKSSDSGFSEKAAAWVVTNAMKIKRKLGMGIPCKKKKKNKNKIKKVSLGRGVIKNAKIALRPFKKKRNNNNGVTGVDVNDLKKGIKVALVASKAAIRNAGGRTKIRQPRIIPVPKRGGLLPLIPIFAGLSALGSLAGGAAAVHKAVKSAGIAQKNLEESQRHNKAMENIILQNKNGNGLFLKPYKRGLGLYLKQAKNF